MPFVLVILNLRSEENGGEKKSSYLPQTRIQEGENQGLGKGLGEHLFKEGRRVILR